MLENYECDKLTNMSKEILAKLGNEGKDQPSHPLKPKICASILVWDDFTKKWMLKAISNHVI